MFRDLRGEGASQHHKQNKEVVFRECYGAARKKEKTAHEPFGRSAVADRTAELARGVASGLQAAEILILSFQRFGKQGFRVQGSAGPWKRFR